VVLDECYGLHRLRSLERSATCERHEEHRCAHGDDQIHAHLHRIWRQRRTIGDGKRQRRCFTTTTDDTTTDDATTDDATTDDATTDDATTDDAATDAATDAAAVATAADRFGVLSDERSARTESKRGTRYRDFPVVGVL
jgi:hypothetical protein